MRTQPDPLARFGGPAETIAASLPKELAEAIRAQVGKRAFSQFVGQAVARELIDRNRAAYVEGMEALHGPLDPAVVAEYEKIFDR
ncbi:MAG: hypothetical protein NVS2B17_18080 [Candidatus Velthaea sp.]